MNRFVAAALATCCCLLTSPLATSAAGLHPQTANGAGAARSSSAPSLKAAAFALPALALPHHSQVLWQGVASSSTSKRALVPHLAPISFAREGRTAGYYVDTIQTNGGHAVYTQYLVSIFGSAAQARKAFNAQRSGYQRLAALSHSYTSTTSKLHVGDREAFGTSLATVGGQQFYTREEYFVRGSVMAEVVQSLFVRDSVPWGHAARAYLYSIARQLDALALKTLPTSPDPVPGGAPGDSRRP